MLNNALYRYVDDTGMTSSNFCTYFSSKMERLYVCVLLESVQKMKMLLPVLETVVHTKERIKPEK